MSDACETAYLCLIFSEETGWFNELWLFIALLVYSVVVHIFQVPEMPHNITGLPKTELLQVYLKQTELCWNHLLCVTNLEYNKWTKLIH